MRKSGILSASAKKIITRDWGESFPSLAVYKPMWLLKRHGPLLMGVILDRTRSNDVYIPKFHVHNLLAPSPAIILSLAYPVPGLRQPKLARQIKVIQHQEDYLAEVSFLKDAVPAIEMPELTWGTIVQLYGDFIRQRRDYSLAKYCMGIFTDVVLLAYWCGHADYATRCQEEAIRLMSRWIPAVDVISWQNIIHTLVDPSTMRQTLESELNKHKLQNIPSFPLIGDGGAESITDVYVKSWTQA